MSPRPVELAAALADVGVRRPPRIVVGYPVDDVADGPAGGRLVRHARPDADDPCLGPPGRPRIDLRDGAVTFGQGTLHVERGTPSSALP